MYWYVLIHLRTYWHVFACVGMYCSLVVCIDVYLVCIDMYHLVLVHICVYWYVLIIPDSCPALLTTERSGSYIQQRLGQISVCSGAIL